MGNIIVALPKIEDAKKIRNLLNRYDFQVSAICTLGATLLQEIERLESGVIICGNRLGDMYYTQLLEYLPPFFDLLLIGSAQVLAEKDREEIVALETPVKVFDLVNTVRMILSNQERKRRKREKRQKLRSEQDEKQIQKAKHLLMERNHLSETEAYRYIQKNSMDTGTNLVETAQMILMLFYGEV